tara:strand:+ start:1109 stop:1771 length:663 start_codon:yes stop_codon:yes gene_type:complete
MVHISYIWLLVSHLTVIYPVYISYKNNINKWLHLIISLVLTAITSTIYHVADFPEIDKDTFMFLGLDYNVYKNLDFFGSYFSIFLTIFSVIHFEITFIYQNVIIVLLSYLSCFFAVSNIEWYYFTLFCVLFSVFISFIFEVFSASYVFKMICKFPSYPILGTITLFFSLFMQFFLALFYDTDNYPIYHGFWHFFMFLSSGYWIKWNNLIIENEKQKDNNV